MTGFGVVFSFYTQAGLGFTPLQAGLTALPQAVGGVAGFALAMAGLQEKLGRGSCRSAPS
ncbi:hypothetical protein GCM10020220_062350 [Nonomuraea rubra]|uniref:hypothetical protein n=1 Tax=Nonomuraea rubra TaxID=46180 RepID=UPI0031EC398C